MLGLQENYRK